MYDGSHQASFPSSFSSMRHGHASSGSSLGEDDGQTFQSSPSPLSGVGPYAPIGWPLQHAPLPSPLSTQASGRGPQWQSLGRDEGRRRSVTFSELHSSTDEPALSGSPLTAYSQSSALGHQRSQSQDSGLPLQVVQHLAVPLAWDDQLQMHPSSLSPQSASAGYGTPEPNSSCPFPATQCRPVAHNFDPVPSPRVFGLPHDRRSQSVSLCPVTASSSLYDLYESPTSVTPDVAVEPAEDGSFWGVPPSFDERVPIDSQAYHSAPRLARMDSVGELDDINGEGPSVLLGPSVWSSPSTSSGPGPSSDGFADETLASSAVGALSDACEIRRVLAGTERWLALNLPKSSTAIGGELRVGKKRMSADDLKSHSAMELDEAEQKKSAQRLRNIQNSRKFRDKRKEYIHGLEVNLAQALSLARHLLSMVDESSDDGQSDPHRDE